MQERHTEEEYAFKLAISLSLKPYAEFVSTSDDEAREYLKPLISEIFDNPVNRLYLHNRNLSDSPLDSLMKLASKNKSSDEIEKVGKLIKAFQSEDSSSKPKVHNQRCTYNERFS